MKIANNYQILPLSHKNIHQKNDINKNNYLSRTIPRTDTISFGDYEDDIERKRIEAASTMEYKPEELVFIKKNIDIEDKAKRRKLYADFKFRDWMNKGQSAFERISEDIVTLGINELYNLQYRLESRENSKKWVPKAELIRTDMLNAKANEQAAEITKQRQKIEAKIAHIAAFNALQTDEISPKFFDKIQARKEGMSAEVPNCVMVSNKSEEINEKIINWIMLNVNANVSELDAYDFPDWDNIFEQAQEQYKKTGKWNVIYVKDLDKLINPKIADSADIAMMKSVMADSAKYYHTTLLFSTTTPDELDETAVETYRVTRINSQDLKPIEQIVSETIKKRLKDEEYIRNTPLSAINDLVDLAGLHEKHKLDFYSNRNKMDKTVQKIREKLTEKQVKKYESVLRLAQESAWYCLNDEGKLKNITEPMGSAIKVENGLVNIVGMHSLKEDLRDIIINPIKQSGIKATSGGFLLYGPLKCGKTFIAEKLANELERYCVIISPSSIKGESKQDIIHNIKIKFEEAKQNTPSVIIIDDIDDIAPSRGSIRVNEAPDYEGQTAELIKGINAARKNDILIICTSNKPQNIDRAVKKACNFDKKIFIPNPDKRSRRLLIMEELDKIKPKDIVDIELLADKTNCYTPGDIKNIFNAAHLKATKDNTPLNTGYIMEEIDNYTPFLDEDTIEQIARSADD